MHNYTDYIDVWDIILLPVYLIIIFLVSKRIKNKHIDDNPAYKYYTTGLFIKIAGGILFTLIYIFYYKCGDTLNYYSGGRALINLLFKHPYPCLSILFGNTTVENWSYFDITTGWPMWSIYFLKPDSFAVMRLIIPFLLISVNKFLLCTIILDWVVYAGIWRFYLMLCEIYPKMTKQFAIAVFCIPSLIFWGSGIMKDTFTFAATLWFTYSAYMIFIKKNKIPVNIIVLIINFWVLIMLKPYIIIALLPNILVWILFKQIKSIKNKVLRYLSAPALLVIGIIICASSLSIFSKKLGSYSSIDSAIKKAQVTQQDLIRDQYGTNSFNIGSFDASFSSIISKAPAAITAGLFRPFIWEAHNVTMLISGIENFIFLIVFIYFLFYIGLFKVFKFIIQDPLLIFFSIFVLIFSFSIGLTTANFGALVRLKIPATIFFVLLLFILYQKNKEFKQSLKSP